MFLASVTNTYPITLAGGVEACVPGGQIMGQYDRSSSWDEMHGATNNAAIALPTECFTVTQDRAVWDNAVAEWRRRHPEVGN